MKHGYSITLILLKGYPMPVENNARERCLDDEDELKIYREINEQFLKKYRAMIRDHYSTVEERACLLGHTPTISKVSKRYDHSAKAEENNSQAGQVG
jgi:hypothetical protein